MSLVLMELQCASSLLGLRAVLIGFIVGFLITIFLLRFVLLSCPNPELDGAWCIDDRHKEMRIDKEVRQDNLEAGDSKAKWGARSKSLGNDDRVTKHKGIGSVLP